ncbi:MAG: class F sortase [Actinobacteria bacterium QS_8_72_14]|nr:MAG: class F sortase [Actinobacteria bacterium QS_8_72_14]
MPAGEGVSAGEGLAPARISIPAIDVDAEVIDLGLNADGTMEVPDDFSVTGWFRHGANPGEQGPSVIAGHVDSKAGPAVFYRLGELDAGHQIEVADAQGRTVTYEVQRVGQYSKEAFPTDKVYAFTEEPTLRLVTCGGPFNETIGHYEHNVIVFAQRVA